MLRLTDRHYEIWQYEFKNRFAHREELPKQRRKWHATNADTLIFGYVIDLRCECRADKDPRRQLLTSEQNGYIEWREKIIIRKIPMHQSKY